MNEEQLKNLDLVNFDYLLEMIQDQAMIKESRTSMKKLLIEENLAKIKQIKKYNEFIEVCKEQMEWMKDD